MNPLHNLAHGLGQVASGLTQILTLGFAPNPRLDLKIERLVRNWEYDARRRQTVRDYDRTTFRVEPEGGTYITRERRAVQVKPNTTGWYDKLPFVVLDSRGEPAWTVDERGWAYPPSLSGHPAKTPMDIVRLVQ